MKKILIIAGDPSGEKHAANLVKAMKVLDERFEFYGIGGDQMRRVGVDLLYHISKLAIMGFTEILKHLPLIHNVLKKIKLFLKNEKPSAVILVDYPGFNLRVAKIAKKLNIPVIYYICPQLWAWGEKRVEKIRKYVDLPLVIFKFEEEFFARHGIRAEFVGHPLVDQLDNFRAHPEFRKLHSIPAEARIIGLFPGSRESEVRRLLPVMAESLNRLQLDVPFRAIVARAPHLPTELYKPYLNEPSIILNKADAHSLMKESYLALVASGTATLELGYFQVPMIVMYKVSFISYWLGKMLISIDKIALVNILLEEKLIPEIIQYQATAEKVVPQIHRFFQDPEYYSRIQKKLGKLKEILGPPGATRRAAKLICDYLG